MDMVEQFWKISLGVAGLASIGSFVLWSLYKKWLNLPIFSILTKHQQFKLLRLFLILTFLFSALALVAYAYIQTARYNAGEIIQQQGVAERDSSYRVVLEDIYSYKETVGPPPNVGLITNGLLRLKEYPDKNQQSKIILEELRNDKYLNNIAFTQQYQQILGVIDSVESEILD